jgi:WhiB family redox-sensing transcriptional regulator
MPTLQRSLPQAGRPAFSPARAGSWQELGACADDGDPDAWFAEAYATDRIKHALAVGAGCPVRLECLDFAVGTGERHGIWGGLTADERAARIAARAGTEGRTPGGLSPMEMARKLDDLRARHGSVGAAARAAEMSRSRVSFYLALLDLDEETQARVHEGTLGATAAVEAVRSQRRAS